jgi:hypothetical protein
MKNFLLQTQNFLFLLTNVLSNHHKPALVAVLEEFRAFIKNLVLQKRWAL